jgi:ABC-2 type transport system ATP-binding protein
MSSLHKKRKLVLDGLNLTIGRGESYALLGPNGAGKSTTVKLLLGLLRPDKGSAAILGQPAGSAAALAKIGFLPENPSVYKHLTGREFLQLSGSLAGVAPAKLETTINNLLARLSLQEFAGEQVGKYSLGNQQRLGLAQALLGDPEVLFLDEPLNGLDPIGRGAVRALLQELTRQGKTIFLTSHLLNDVEILCQRCGILMGGKLLTEANIADVLGSDKYKDLDDYFIQTIKSAEMAAEQSVETSAGAQ